MRDDAPFRLSPVLLLLAMAACTEPTRPDLPDDPAARIQTSVAASCNVELIESIAVHVRAFYSQPELTTAQQKLLALHTACRAGNQAQTTLNAWELLALMESALDQQRAGPATAGDPLANKLLACTSSLCDPAVVPGIDFTASLGAGGMFAVRGAGTTDVLARDSRPFLDFQGQPNTALWGVEVDASWSSVMGGHIVLVYGAPENSLVLDELNLGLRYDVKTYPDVAFAEGQLHVGVCFGSEVEFPTIGDAEATPVLRREGILLEAATPGFCAPAVQSASVFGAVTSLVRNLFPNALGAWSLGKAGGLGGTPLDFSRFAPVASNPAGGLEFLSLPPGDVIVGESIGEIRIRAASGDRTPMEKVTIRLVLRSNNGKPAGAYLFGDTESVTGELEGGVAVFPDDGNLLRVGKPGGYKLCAEAARGGFDFTPICTDVINARKP